MPWSEGPPGDDDPASWHVYADGLAERGDPRGEVALLELAGDVVAADAAFARLADLGDLGDDARFTRRHGFAQALHVHSEQPGALAAIATRALALPVAATVRRVEVGLARPDGNWTPVVNAIAASPIAGRLRALVFDASDQLVRNKLEDRRLDHAAMDDYWEARAELLEACAPIELDEATVWAPFVALEELTFDGPIRGQLGTLTLPSLRALVLRSDQLDDLASLVGGPWPRLAHLELSFGASSTIAWPELLVDAAFPALTHLALRDAPDDDIVEALVASPLLERLTSLDLSGTFTTRGVEPLGAHAARFGHLATLELSRSHLTAAMVAALRARLPNLVVDDHGPFPARYRDVVE
ncbi:MAG: hypothetical protein NT062_31265 [Proteobacteria bacterium]|nr:hypothetical protein [Pseudomonadota bacterium]